MRHDQIMDCASELFSKGCYNCVSLSDIAQQVGIKKPSIYAYFSSKEELFLAVIDKELEKMYSYIDEEFNKAKNCDAETSLYKLLQNFIEYNFNNSIARGLWRCMLYSPALDLQHQINDRTSALEKKVNNIQTLIMKKGIDAGEITEQNLENLIYSYTCLIKGNFAMVLSDSNYSLDKLNYCWKIYWNGIKK
jgi:TetR/AcrR family transcriptional regulator, cmeABC operon repressor